MQIKLSICNQNRNGSESGSKRDSLWRKSGNIFCNIYYNTLPEKDFHTVIHSNSSLDFYFRQHSKLKNDNAKECGAVSYNAYYRAHDFFSFLKEPPTQEYHVRMWPSYGSNGYQVWE